MQIIEIKLSVMCIATYRDQSRVKEKDRALDHNERKWHKCTTGNISHYKKKKKKNCYSLGSEINI